MHSLGEQLREARQRRNQEHGLYCWGNEDDERLWSLWRDSDDTQLTPWMDLGPEGMIAVVQDWKGAKGERELLLALEQRDDSASPPILRQALMHLPSGRQSEFRFAGGFEGIDPVSVNLKVDHFLPVRVKPHDWKERPDVRGTALYGDHFQELVGPFIRFIEPVADGGRYLKLGLDRGGVSEVWGLFDHKAANFVVPAEYDELFEHHGHWIARRPDGGSDVRAADGKLVARHSHCLAKDLLARGETRLIAEREGLFGWADATGKIMVEPYAKDLEHLFTETISFLRLSVQAGPGTPFCLDAATLSLLNDAIEKDLSLPYEGVEIADRSSDGVLEITSTTLPGGASAWLLEDKWGDLRLLVLRQPWRKLAPGCVLRLRDRSRACVLPDDSGDVILLQVVLGLLKFSRRE